MNIVPFQFENKSVRVVKDENGDPWFVAADVCAALGLDDTSKACSRLDVDERGTNTVRTPSGDQNMLVINESGMYSLTLTSRKDEAKRFKKWVTSEVLPSIRKTGSYSSYNVVAIPNFSNPAEAARAWAEQYEARQLAELTKAQIGDRREATAMNTASQATKRANKLEIELDRSKEYATVKRMQMIHHGQPFDWRRLRSISAEMGIQTIDVFDANYGTVKAYHADVWKEAYALEIVPMVKAA